MADTIDQERRAALAKLIEMERWKHQCVKLLDDLFSLIALRPGGIEKLEADMGREFVDVLDKLALLKQGRLR